MNSSNTDSPILQHPETWKTGDEPMTDAQRAYLETLAREAGEPWDAQQTLTKAQAAQRIEALQHRTGRDR
ncbi:MAG TPA: DUF3072 domain-containing protein [Steroidobacteraceae bacterium]|jgi:hypothetical protein